MTTLANSLFFKTDSHVTLVDNEICPRKIDVKLMYEKYRFYEYVSAK